MQKCYALYFPILMLMWQANSHALYFPALMLMWQANSHALYFPALMLMWQAKKLCPLFPCPHAQVAGIIPMPSISLPSCSGGKLKLYALYFPALMLRWQATLHTLPPLKLRLRINNFPILRIILQTW